MAIELTQRKKYYSRVVKNTRGLCYMTILAFLISPTGHLHNIWAVVTREEAQGVIYFLSKFILVGCGFVVLWVFGTSGRWRCPCRREGITAFSSYRCWGFFTGSRAADGEKECLCVSHLIDIAAALWLPTCHIIKPYKQGTLFSKLLKA